MLWRCRGFYRNRPPYPTNLQLALGSRPERFGATAVRIATPDGGHFEFRPCHGGLGSDEWRVNDANCDSGRIFATLASVKEGYGNLMLTPRTPGRFRQGSTGGLPAGQWRMGWDGATYVRLSSANKDLLAGALRVEWQVKLKA